MAVADFSDRPLSELVSLSGRCAVVTGAARGLGKAICARLAEAGASVLAADLDEPAARKAADELRSVHGREVAHARLDVTDSGSVCAVADAALKVLGGLDIWVNNAGIFPNTPLLETSDEDWDRVLDVNLRGVFLGCREAARRMIARRTPGVIVNIASVASFGGMAPGVTHYVASKHGVRGATSQLAIELAPHSIRVLGVAPTTILTEGILSAHAALERRQQAPQKVSSPLGRGGVPDDVARVVLFCASDLAAFMTGETLLVDAGRLAAG